MISFLDAEARLEQARIPGVDGFYQRFDPDPWQKCNDDLRDALEVGDGVSSSHAIVSYEQRKRRLLSIYKQFLEIQNAEPESDHFSEAYMQEAITGSRDLILCDQCRRSASEARSIHVFSVCEPDLLGDPRRVIHALCIQCESKGKKHARR